MAMNCVSRCAAISVFRKRIAIQTLRESGTSRVCWRVMESPCSSQRYRRIATHGGMFATPPFAEGIPFIEVFVDAPLETVIARDTKGLYKRALAGDVASSRASRRRTSRQKPPTCGFGPIAKPSGRAYGNCSTYSGDINSNDWYVFPLVFRQVQA